MRAAGLGDRTHAMADYFYSPKQRLAEARAAIEKLGAAQDAFNEREPFERLVESDPDGWIQTHSVKLVEALPESLAEHVVEAAQALRAALDQTIFAAGKASGSMGVRETAFPIAESQAALDKLIEETCKGVPEWILAAIKEFQPTRDGNILLWGIQAILKAEKYALVVPTGGAKSGLTFVHNVTPPEVRWNDKTRELELGTFPIHGVFERNLSVYFAAALGAVEGLEKREALPLLEEMAGEVERVIRTLETVAASEDVDAE